MSEVRGTARAQVPARILDLSIGGALLHLPAALSVGAIHDFALQIDGQTIWVQGEVRRCEASERATGFHVGVQFVGIDPQDERLLRAYLEKAGA
jgi:c-di-GMP-binding flagellar brake protein YcgR